MRFYEILNSESQFFSGLIRAEMPILGQRLAEAYMVLSIRYLDRNQKLCKFVPKFHLWEHLTEYQAAEFGNPRYFWTYADEDLVGLVI